MKQALDSPKVLYNNRVESIENRDCLAWSMMISVNTNNGNIYNIEVLL